MKIAIQQPYFYPYLGYFQLIQSVDLFVLFDDVQYIRRGWINRNKLSENHYITVPIKKTKREEKIKNIKISYETNWHYKHCRFLETKYGKYCCDHPIYTHYKNINKHIYLCNLLEESLKITCNFLKIKTVFLKSSEMSEINNLKSEKKIIEICKKFNAKEYYNLPGGKRLYDENNFKKNNIKLNFIETNQLKNKLSILDVVFKNQEFSL